MNPRPVGARRLRRGDRAITDDNQETRPLTSLQLALCAVAVWGGAAAAFYLYRTVHWMVGIVIVVYLWILLMDVCGRGRQSITWHLLDFLHHLLSFAGTALVVTRLWAFEWWIAAAAAVPVFIVLLVVTGFLLLRLYALTPEGHADWQAQEETGRSRAPRCVSPKPRPEKSRFAAIRRATGPDKRRFRVRITNVICHGVSLI